MAKIKEAAFKMALEKYEKAEAGGNNTGMFAVKKPTEESAYQEAILSLPFAPNTLGLFSQEDLAQISIPMMSPTALAGEAMAFLSSIGNWIDPIQGPIKAACLAGRICL